MVNPYTGQVHDLFPLFAHLHEHCQDSLELLADHLGGASIFMTTPRPKQSADGMAFNVAFTRDLGEVFDFVARPYATVQEGRADA